MIHEERLNRKIIGLLSDQTMPEKNPLRIGIADENGLLTGIEKNAVGGLQPDASDIEKFVAKDRKRFGLHGRIASGKFFQEKPDEGFQSLRFQMIIAGGPDDPGKLVFWNMKKRRGGQ